MIEKKERKVVCQLGPYENDRPTFIVYHFKQLCKKLCPYVKNLVTYLVNASCCLKKKTFRVQILPPQLLNYQKNNF